ncbi:prephenate dehydrogenase [Dinghuibacter silviterrae]|uniref:Prephenate dehydrogenase n=1 Tax=Dinghuibacter silviterrae TaxID=1539049 RepID=A0A4R8DHU3_9BACT|nr:prephenate dehydrogenase [Dinghuibacter silviterrae]TDW96520.1 prephenate dehydrogenase [Dinghuibacter silviterrae]
MVVAIVGTGLIGGSMALTLKEKGFAERVIGVDSSLVHLQKARELGIIDEGASLEAGVDAAKLIILAIPVDAGAGLLPQVLTRLKPDQVVMDVGSTKEGIIAAARKLPNRARFVATHPMWGTEFSGPQAAEHHAFAGRAAVICDREDSAPDALALVEQVYDNLEMRKVYMDAASHDMHAAYVSHISHITSFALANTVLEKEKEEDAIFTLASGGFESTVRLAKSNPSMWVPIFRENRENVLDVLNEHITQLRKFKSCLEKENYTYLKELIEQAGEIRRVLNK